MNEIRFTNQYSEFDKLIVPIIDGKSLISILKDFEKPFAKSEGHSELAGGYEGVPNEFVETPSEYYFGKIKNKWSGDKTVILDCPCLIVGCWSFVTKIEANQNTIIWKAFEQIHRNNWDYSNLSSFVFNKALYQMALEELEKNN